MWQQNSKKYIEDIDLSIRGTIVKWRKNTMKFKTVLEKIRIKKKLTKLTYSNKYIKVYVFAIVKNFSNDDL